MTQANGDRWTIAALKEYIDLRDVESEKRTILHVEQLEKAIDRNCAYADKRFDDTNKFKELITSQQRDFLPRAEYELAHKILEVKEDITDKRVDKIENMKAGASNLWIIIIAVIAFISSVIGIIFTVTGR